MIHILVVCIAFLIDEIITVIFPNSLLVNDLMLIPNLGFCTMILTIRKFSLLDGCLFAFGFGMFYDALFSNEFMIYAIVYVLITFLMHIWGKHMTDTLLESITIVILTIFVKDILIYWYMSFQGVTQMSFWMWVQHHELLTVLVNGLCAILIVYALHIKEDYLEMKARRIRKGERVEWFRLKSKE